MAGAKRYTNRIIWGLLAVVIVQFVALASVLVTLDGRSNEPLTGETDIPASDMPGVELPEEPLIMETPFEEPADETPAAVEKEPPENALTAPEILASANVISHGMGMIEGVTTLNCLESFRLQYEKGVRVFEVDLRMTKDHRVVLRHDWRAGWQSDVSETNVPTLDEFRAKPLLGKYTPLTFKDLLLLMEEYPDICIITDTKFTDAEAVTVQFEAMLADAEELGLSYLFDRMVIQVYNRLMFKVVDSIGDFPHYIYTLYAEGFNKTEDAFSEIGAFCAESGIRGVTMWDFWWKAEFEPIAREYGVDVYVHTVNDAGAAQRLLESGVSGIYTDQIIPADLPGETVEGEVADAAAEETAQEQGD